MKNEDEMEKIKSWHFLLKLRKKDKMLITSKLMLEAELMKVNNDKCLIIKTLHNAYIMLISNNQG